jgi:phosphoribosyl-ATP pyrophosphohydrolase
VAEVYDVIRERLNGRSEASYVASLAKEGQDAILRKVSEESCEVLLAAKKGDRRQIVREITDLWFHLLVLMATAGISPTDIEAEFGARFGTSGLTEKRARAGD